MKKNSMHDPVFSLSHKLFRVLWFFVYFIFFRYTPPQMFKWRRFILSIFGADVAKSSRIYSSVKIWFPKNLTVGDHSTIGPFVNVYNQGYVTIGEGVVVSQGAYICASTHDYNDSVHPLILSPILVKNNVWICAEAFVGPGVTLNDGVVVGARAVINRATEEWSVYAGNPAVKIKDRKRFDEP